MSDKINIRDKASMTVIKATDKYPKPIKCPQCGRDREYIVRCEHCGHIKS